MLGSFDGALAAQNVVAGLTVAFSALPEVTAIALAGSRAGGPVDQRSDIDLYVYGAEPPLPVRAGIAGRFGRAPAIGNTLWEPGDEWIDSATGILVDVMYRTPAWIESQLDRALVEHQASLGYSTCFWHNVLVSRPLFDRTGWFAGLQARARTPYPEPLRANIIRTNLAALRGMSTSLVNQLASAVARRDRVSVNHRSTAILASYFDVIFAVNARPHPGEKRLIQQVKATRDRCPRDFESSVAAFVTSACQVEEGDVVIRAAHQLLDGLDELVRLEGFLPPAQ